MLQRLHLELYLRPSNEIAANRQMWRVVFLVYVPEQIMLLWEQTSKRNMYFFTLNKCKYIPVFGKINLDTPKKELK